MCVRLCVTQNCATRPDLSRAANSVAGTARYLFANKPPPRQPAAAQSESRNGIRIDLIAFLYFMNTAELDCGYHTFMCSCTLHRSPRARPNAPCAVCAPISIATRTSICLFELSSISITRHCRCITLPVAVVSRRPPLCPIAQSIAKRRTHTHTHTQQRGGNVHRKRRCVLSKKRNLLSVGADITNATKKLPRTELLAFRVVWVRVRFAD